MAIAPASKAGGVISVRGFESLSLRRVEAWQSGDCSGLEHRRPRGARRFESYSLRPWKVGRIGYCTVLLRRRPLGVCEFEPRTFRPPLERSGGAT